MSKKVKGFIKLQIEAGKATPAPPVGPALGQYGVNIMEFCKAYNDHTKDKPGMVIPVIITAYEDGSFTFITKTPPASKLIKKELGIKSANNNPGRDKPIKVSKDIIKKVAEVKMPDLNTSDLEQAMLIVAGTARSMGCEVVES